MSCPCQFFRTNPYDVISSSCFRRPAAPAINFHPATGQTTSGKCRYPNPMFTFRYGYRHARLFELKIQVCRFTWFERRIIDGTLNGTIHNQCHPVLACRETLEIVTAVYIRFSRREQSASLCRLNPDIRALNRMSVSILDDSLQYGTRGRCTCDKKHDPNKTNTNRFHKHNRESASVSNPVEDKIVMNSVRNDNFAKPVWPKTENFVDMRSGSDQTDARTRG